MYTRKHVAREQNIGVRPLLSRRCFSCLKRVLVADRAGQVLGAYVALRGHCAELLDRQVALVLPQHIQKPLVIRRDVEQLRHTFVAPSGEAESLANDRAQIVASDVPRHERLVDDGPERFTVTHHPLE